MSKRYLKKLVDTGVVSGWSDPRMPTLSGMKERGYPPQAIRAFCEAIGVSKANSEVDVAYLEHFVRDYLNINANRVMVVKDPIKLTILNAEDEEYEIENNPNAEEKTTRKVTFSKNLYIDRDDFAVVPPPKYKRLTVGGTVRLKGSYIIEYVSHVCDEEGKVVEVMCNYIPKTISGQENANMKVKGVIQWVNAKDCVDLVINDYDYLLLDGEGDFDKRITPNSHIVYNNAKGEACLKDAKPYDRFQFMRIGYYSAVKDYGNGKYEFNEITGLKDSYGK